MRSVSGIVVLDKPAGYSSNQALQAVRRLFRADKGGHTGALDPLATGVLPICLGQATKLSAYLLAADKRYRVRAALGSRTDTGDADGAVTERSDPASLTRAQLESALAAFTGDIRQRPPMYSALKRAGRPLYELARAGVTVERAERPVQVSRLEITDFGPGYFELDACVSKGTYIRSLVEDLAAAVAQCAHVAQLRRLEAGPFGEKDTVTLAALEAAAAEGESVLDRFLLPPLAGLPAWPRVAVTPEQAARLAQGQIVAASGGRPGAAAVTDEGGNLLGLAEVSTEGALAPRRWFSGAS